MSHSHVLKVNNLSKSFGPTQALQDVSLVLSAGEIRGLIGENGSGKSTLSNIIVGIIKPDSGEMELRGEKYQPHSMLDADRNKISMIVQEMATINKISVAANLFSGQEMQFGRFGLINQRRMNTAAKEALLRIGVDWIEPESDIDTISFEDRKLVELARAVENDPDILIVDETTTALSQKGREIMYRIMQELKDQNKSVLFISHDLSEIIDQCDTVTVLRDGQLVDTLEKEQMEIHRIQYLMIGRNITEGYYRSDYDFSHSDEVVLKIENVSYDQLQNVSINLHRGEILGIGGLSDCGMHDLGKIAFGLLKPESGSVTLPARNITIKSPAVAIKNKIGYMSKNRDQEALLLSTSIKSNVCLPSLDILKKAFIIARTSEKKLANRVCSALDVRMSSINQHCMYLSGGNKQKVVVAKWLGNESDILIMDCPTRGIDIGVKQMIYQLMQDLKAEGKAILMISEELPELIGMSDNILIMKDGRISASFQRSEDLTEAQIIKYMIS
ncbi:MAG: sugar ABC transporter ATP-binding protein [Saccharofermentanales bacterium]|jgi:ribose transport system ATP-binding protein|nr:sugar ABC transporter ATP-binding protein [Clostridiaceae bacterium]